MSCPFCKIIAESKNKIYSDEWVSILLDIDPISKGHVLVVPNEHFLDIDELPVQVLQHLFLVAQKYVAILKKTFAPMGYSIMQNGGAFNDVDHFHLHVFPRFNKEEFSWQYAEKVDKEAFDFEYIASLLNLSKSMEPPPSNK